MRQHTTQKIIGFAVPVYPNSRKGSLNNIILKENPIQILNVQVSFYRDI